MPRSSIAFRRNASLEDAALNALFAASWPGHQTRSFQPVLSKSLAWVTAWQGPDLVGFVNLAWDGGRHGFILDTTVHPQHRRSGIGLALIQEALKAAREAGLEWVHVDFEPKDEAFYRKAGFQGTAAGLMRLQG